MTIARESRDTMVTTHLNVSTGSQPIKDELESKKSKRYEGLARHADESARMLALVLDEWQAMRNAAEKHWKEAQEEVDKEIITSMKEKPVIAGKIHSIGIDKINLPKSL